MKQNKQQSSLMILSKQGYNLCKALDGQMALTACQILPDLILLDLIMLDMDGYTVCQQLKSQEATSKVS